MDLNNNKMDKCLQISLKKYINDDKININDKIVILYHHTCDRYITHCYINNNGNNVYSYEFGEIKNMGHVIFEPLQDKLMLKSLCRQTNIHFMFDQIYSYLDIKKVFYRYIDDEITCYDDNDIVFNAISYSINIKENGKELIHKGWKIIERLF